ncbi:MAG: type II secretion system GspH family protein [bacterium]|nr:type II secretion system GspH family protein [bacterium]
MIKRGFTLAEVLVTLLVIGVIAALTIPQLINSTEERQYKTAYKKAVSTIANATELMEANEVSCSVETDADLAKCMKNAIKGSTMSASLEERLIGGVSNLFGTPAFASAPPEEEESNVLITQDGMAFMFFLSDDYHDKLDEAAASTPNYKAPKRALSKICPNFTTDANYFVPELVGFAESNCTVVVDLDGFGKNSRGFADFSRLEDYYNAGDIQILGFSGKGEVRPAYVHSPDEALDINKGYKYLYGEEAFEKLVENYVPPIDCYQICCSNTQDADECEDKCSWYMEEIGSCPR